MLTLSMKINGFVRFVGSIFFIIILIYGVIGIFTFFGFEFDVYIIYLMILAVAVLLFGILPQGVGDVFLPIK